MILGDHNYRIAKLRQNPQTRACNLQFSFDRLICIGHPAKCEILRRPRRLRATDLEDKVAQDFRTVLCVVNFRMKLS